MRRVTWLLSLALLSGCAAEQAAAPAPTKGPDPRPRMEQIKADCMKQKGFKYIAFVSPEQPKPDLSTYEAIKVYRQKYGFGVFAQYVYPKDPLSGSIESSPDHGDPNHELVWKLNDRQLASYNKAKDSCYQKAAKEVLNKEVGSKLKGVILLRDARKQLEAAEIDGDTELVGLASAFADCLVRKGQRMSTTKPTALAKRGENQFFDEADKLGKAPNEPLDLTPAQARPYLDREVKAAMEDLECGKDFYTRFAPKQASINTRVWAEYGPLLGR
ncbi:MULTISPECIES: hypothetical protein [Nonomuraea]|uniref:Lipoprotein n=1 Tax=Nonomuraea mangrovi TaxID=2316207 RepID=A0ABW4TEL1_9ACTN